MGAPVIVTRPAAPGRRLADALRACGRDAAWWPAFEIAAPPDEAQVRAALSRLHTYDLALFVSPNAVHATAARLSGDWPPGTAIGAVGAGTGAAALTELRGAAAATLIAPNDGDEPGSEGFWRAWRAAAQPARRVLVLRAATGRDWIIEQLRAEDAAVDTLAVYERRPLPLPEGARERLHGWMTHGAAPVTIFSSAEAVGAVLEQVRTVQGAVAWLRTGHAIATHPRVAERLRASGFERVDVTAASDSDVIGKLESITG